MFSWKVNFGLCSPVSIYSTIDCNGQNTNRADANTEVKWNRCLWAHGVVKVYSLIFYSFLLFCLFFFALLHWYATCSARPSYVEKELAKRCYNPRASSILLTQKKSGWCFQKSIYSNILYICSEKQNKKKRQHHNSYFAAAATKCEKCRAAFFSLFIHFYCFFCAAACRYISLLYWHFAES